VIGRPELVGEDGPLFAVVGVFDGLHLGHAYMLEHLVAEARARTARPTVITFDAHPDAVLLGHAPPLLMDPAERLGHRRPFVLDVTGHAADQKALEAFLGFARVAGLDQKAREVRAADQPLAGDIFHRAFVRARDAGRCQRIGDAAGAMRAPVADRRQSGEQRRALGIDAKCHDVQGDVAPADRKLGAGNKAHAGVLRGRARLGQPADLVVVGQRPDIDAAQRRALRDGGGRQQSVGVGRMAVQIVAEHRCRIARRGTA